ncbi:OmpA family protein [Thiohalocapsa sp. ML1]|jgi:outer membrane protein OmpA-like peptidoglycan-associated protein|uniref:OmpA family protein n=1 Tax=Thiohalocapsa sp. ML1 TaxID=1431688 RepID=UPI0007322BCE|nr:OmpA family protein [Thiohalocapsa sp. ML1]
MNTPNQTHPAPAAARTGAKTGLRNTAILGLLATLFAGGLGLLYVLLPGAELRLAREAPKAEATPAAAAPAAETAPPPPAVTAEPAAVEAAAAAALAALEAELAATRARVDDLAEQAVGFAEAGSRLDALESDVAAARAAADAAAAQAAEVAARYTGLTGDYARLGARFTSAGVLIRLDDAALGFAPGSAELPAAADAALTDIADFLKRHPGQRAQLRGHTDATGQAATNVRLSGERAAAVRNALIDLGVPAERLSIEGVGAAEPIADNATAAGRGQNRRVDILLGTDNTAG